ncbi:MAG: phosphoribosyltransferase [Candidatus Hydrogenedentales bacterium]
MDHEYVFSDRLAAGERLAELVEHLATEDPVVLALPRGGVPVAYPVARHLRAPLDVVLVRKLGAPGHEEFAIGAIAEGGYSVLNRQVVSQLGVVDEQLSEIVAREAEELDRRGKLYRGDAPPISVEGMTAILIDDGLATGATMLVAVEAVRARGPKKLVVAVPVAPPESCEMLRAKVDEVICAVTPDPFRSVSLWYRQFQQTTDDEVRDLLQRAQRWAPSANTAH